MIAAPPAVVPVVTVIRRHDTEFTAVEASDFGPRSVHRALLTGGRLDMDRDRRNALITTPFPIDDRDLVHPYLSPIGAMWARWLGREPFHCSAVVLEGRVWGILGRRESGKSTLVAWFASRGIGIYTDDLLVVDIDRGASATGGVPLSAIAYAGPRAIDLRAPAAARLADEVDLESVRGDERYRMRLPAVPWQMPLGGWFILGEADEVALEPVPVAERLRVLADHRMVRLAVDDGVQWMDLATLPTFRLWRPKRWDVMPALLGAMERAAMFGGGGST